MVLCFQMTQIDVVGSLVGSSKVELVFGTMFVELSG